MVVYRFGVPKRGSFCRKIRGQENVEGVRCDLVLHTVCRLNHDSESVTYVYIYIYIYREREIDR